jgi:hypothetical protein
MANTKVKTAKTCIVKEKKCQNVLVLRLIARHAPSPSRYNSIFHKLPEHDEREEEEQNAEDKSPEQNTLMPSTNNKADQ